MSIDENKLLRDLESEVQRDYDVYSQLDREYKLKRQKLRLAIMLLAVLIYTSAGLIYFGFFRAGSSMTLFIKSQIPDNDIQLLQTQLDSLKKQVEGMVSASSTPVSEKFEDRLSSLEDVIQIDPEEALTAVLLRDRISVLEQSIGEIKESQIRLAERFDKLLLFVFAVPIVGGLLSLLFGFLRRKFLPNDS